MSFYGVMFFYIIFALIGSLGTSGFLFGGYNLTPSVGWFFSFIFVGAGVAYSVVDFLKPNTFSKLENMFE